MLLHQNVKYINADPLKLRDVATLDRNILFNWRFPDKWKFTFTKFDLILKNCIDQLAIVETFDVRRWLLENIVHRMHNPTAEAKGRLNSNVLF